MKYTIEHISYEDDIYRVITIPGVVVEILRESDGFPVVMDEYFYDEGEVLKTETGETDEHYTDFIHDYFCKFKPTENEF